jgi:hypothetical protein
MDFGAGAQAARVDSSTTAPHIARRDRPWPEVRARNYHQASNPKEFREMSDSTSVPPVPTPAAPAGWYDDGSGRQRYWDGVGWTDQYADAQPGIPAAPPPAANAVEQKKSRKGLWITIAVVGGVLLLLLLAGIVAAAVGLMNRAADDFTSGGTPVPSAPAEETEAPEDEPDEPEEEPAPPAGTETALFGETWEYTDGISVTVSAPQHFEPSDTAVADDAAAYVVFDVTIVNGSEEPWEPIVITSVQSGNTEAAEVFDTANGLNGTPSTTVLPGREVTFPIGYGVADPEDLVLEITPGFLYDPAIYVSSR